MILYGTAPSPFVRKVNIVIKQLDLSEQIQVESPHVNPVKINTEYYDQVPLGKIPALRLDSGQLIHDSLVICDYLDYEFGNCQLIPRSVMIRANVLTRHSVANGATEAALLLRYETGVRPDALQWPQWISSQWKKVDMAINWFENTPPVSSDLRSIDEISLACFLGYLDFRFAEHNWRAGAPTLANWFEQVSDLDVMQCTDPVLI